MRGKFGGGLPFSGRRLTRELLSHIQERQPLKLTQKGNLPRALVKSLYNLRLFPNKYVDDGSIKLRSEEDFLELHVAHTLCRIAKWVKRRKGKGELTKKGVQMLQGSPASFYQELLKIYTKKYNWAYTERWTLGESHSGQAGWAFVMYELLRQGDTPQGDTYYAKRYFQLLPPLLEAYADSPHFSANKKGESDLRRRFFSQFAPLFGLVEIVSEVRGDHGILKELIVRRSALAARVFELGE